MPGSAPGPRTERLPFSAPGGILGFMSGQTFNPILPGPSGTKGNLSHLAGNLARAPRLQLAAGGPVGDDHDSP